MRGRRPGGRAVRADDARGAGAPWARTATELVAGYRDMSLSPVEVTDAVLARLRELDPLVTAFCLVDEETARRDATASQERWRRGEPLGLLDGVPVSVKDLLLTRGWPTRRGSLSTDPAAPCDEDAPAVARMREHGAVLLGKTTTPEFGWKAVTDGPLTGITRNPWDPSRTSGGSSGGGAAAVALGLGPLAVGTDGGGSIRIPAAFCGVFGLKPTYGRVPLYPASPFGTLAHAGPLTRTAEDAALMMDVLCGQDDRDWSQLPPYGRSFRAQLAEGNGGVRGLRVAWSPGLAGVEAEAGVAARVRHAVDLLADLGAHVEEAAPDFADPVAAFHTLWFSGAAKVVEHLTPRQFGRLDPGLQEICRQGAATSALDHLGAVDTRMALGVLLGRFHRRYDLLVTPTLPGTAFEAGLEVPPGSGHERWTGWTPFTYPFNLTQQPAATVPCGPGADGLPAGVQLVAARNRDDLVLRASHALFGALVAEGTISAAPVEPVLDTPVESVEPVEPVPDAPVGPVD